MTGLKYASNELLFAQNHRKIDKLRTLSQNFFTT